MDKTCLAVIKYNKKSKTLHNYNIKRIKIQIYKNNKNTEIKQK